MESSLLLPDGRTLAYASHGDSSSDTVFLYMHGMFTYGRINTKDQPSALSNGNIFQISPSLPGWGLSSPPPPNTPFPRLLASDMMALLNHVHPTPIKRLYIGGGSFGTLPAQLLYGAPYDMFPHGRQIAGLLLIGAFSPFAEHHGYAKSFTWANYIGVGPPSRYMPFMPYVVKMAMSSKLKTVDGARKFISGMLYEGMGDSERQVFEEWKVKKGKQDRKLETELAEQIVYSVHSSWAGFFAVGPALQGGWGFKISELDEEHSKAPVLIVAGDKDRSATLDMSEWLEKAYKNARLKVLHGGHLVALMHMDEILEEFLPLTSS